MPAVLPLCIVALCAMECYVSGIFNGTVTALQVKFLLSLNLKLSTENDLTSKLVMCSVCVGVCVPVGVTIFSLD